MDINTSNNIEEKINLLPNENIIMEGSVNKDNCDGYLYLTNIRMVFLLKENDCNKELIYRLSQIKHIAPLEMENITSYTLTLLTIYNEKISFDVKKIMKDKWVNSIISTISPRIVNNPVKQDNSKKSFGFKICIISLLLIVGFIGATFFELIPYDINSHLSKNNKEAEAIDPIDLAFDISRKYVINSNTYANDPTSNCITRDTIPDLLFISNNKNNIVLSYKTACVTYVVHVVISFNNDKYNASVRNFETGNSSFCSDKGQLAYLLYLWGLN